MLDRLLLVVAAAASLVVMAGLLAFAQAMGLAEHWEMFVFQTMVWPPIIAIQATRLFRRRHRRLYRRWPLVVAGVGTFLLHCVILGSIIYRFHPDWRGPHWAMIDLVELAIIGIVIELAHEYSVRPQVHAKGS